MREPSNDAWSISGGIEPAIGELRHRLIEINALKGRLV
jgi:hypothetical protein